MATESPTRTCRACFPNLLRRHGRIAFTLIELLVVVAIIAMIIAILLPSLAKARWQARHLQCQTNLSSLCKAWHTYLIDFKGFFPKSQAGSDNAQINFGGRQGVDEAYRGRKPLNRYVGVSLITERGAEMFRCPLDNGSGSVRPTYFEYFGSSYLMNHLLVGPPKLSLPPPRVPLPCRDVLKRVSARMAELNASQLSGESKLLLVGDSGWYNAWERQFPYEFNVEWHAERMRHNIGFMDGHVSFTRIRKGLYTTADYTVIPFREEQASVVQCQQELTCP